MTSTTGYIKKYGEYNVFADLNNPLSPKFADKHALSKMNLTSMEVSMFNSLFLN